MLEHVPLWHGRALPGLRAGAATLALDGARLPRRFTADGEGVSPPLTWGAVPAGTAGIALLVEDADAPTPQPLVHAVLWGIPADAVRLAEGAILAGAPGGSKGDVGRNSFLKEGWLPPDPPAGHGEHRYCFQLFALGAGAGDPGNSPGRSALVEAMRGHVVAAGLLVGRYGRGEPAVVGPAGAMAAPA